MGEEERESRKRNGREGVQSDTQNSLRVVKILNSCWPSGSFLTPEVLEEYIKSGIRKLGLMS